MSTEIVSAEEHHGFQAVVLAGGINNGLLIEITVGTNQVRLSFRQLGILLRAALSYAIDRAWV